MSMSHIFSLLHETTRMLNDVSVKLNKMITSITLFHNFLYLEVQTFVFFNLAISHVLVPFVKRSVNCFSLPCSVFFYCY